MFSYDPCNRCGKSPKNNYDGICMECADDLEISELFQNDIDYQSKLEKAKMWLDSFQNKVGNVSFSSKKERR